MDNFRENFHKVADMIAKHTDKWPVAIRMTDEYIDKIKADPRIYKSELSAEERRSGFYYKFDGLPVITDNTLSTDFKFVYEWGEIGQ